MSHRASRAHGWLLRAGGGLMVLVGGGALVLAPLETICFTWFAEGGRFGYEGFGFGSFMFGNLAIQIAGYYLIAALLIPLGYGHLTLRPWIRPITQALVWCWLVLGVPLTVVLLFILLASKTLTVAVALGAVAACVLAYAVLPAVLLRFYRGAGVTAALVPDAPADRDAAAAGSRRDAAPLVPRPAPLVAGDLDVPRLVVLGLEAFYLVALHVLLLFRGLFPRWTGWATGVPGLALIDAAVVILLLLAWGTYRRSRLAWWGALAYFGAMGVLWVGTLVRTSWVELLAVLSFPPTEVDILDGIPLQGWHLALLVGLPLLLTLVAVLRARPSAEL